MRSELTLLLLLPCFTLTACPPEVGEGKSAGECSDGQDNDGDGAIDCLDAGCMGYAVCGGGDTGEDTVVTDDPDITDDPVDSDPDVIINEFMASNSAALEDQEYPDSFPDWIELFNLTDQPIDLGGYSITDNLHECDKHVLEAGLTLEAGGYLILWADGDEEEGPTHLSFKLNKAGEQLGLCSPEMTPLTKLEYGQQVTDWSAARIPDGSTTWEFDESSTPGEPNAL